MWRYLYVVGRRTSYKTNFQYDLSLRKCITRKGIKYSETVVNSLKQAYSSDDEDVRREGGRQKDANEDEEDDADDPRYLHTYSFYFMFLGY